MWIAMISDSSLRFIQIGRECGCFMLFFGLLSFRFKPVGRFTDVLTFLQLCSRCGMMSFVIRAHQISPDCALFHVPHVVSLHVGLSLFTSSLAKTGGMRQVEVCIAQKWCSPRLEFVMTRTIENKQSTSLFQWSSERLDDVWRILQFLASIAYRLKSFRKKVIPQYLNVPRSTNVQIQSKHVLMWDIHRAT